LIPGALHRLEALVAVDEARGNGPGFPRPEDRHAEVCPPAHGIDQPGGLRRRAENPCHDAPRPDFPDRETRCAASGKVDDPARRRKPGLEHFPG
jgi:hypothetical protein